MKICEIVESLNLNIVVPGDDLEREVLGGYCGDLLSWVMSRAKSGDAWITVMSNINVIAVASLCDVACVILADGAELDPVAVERAQAQSITVLSTNKSSFEISRSLPL